MDLKSKKMKIKITRLLTVFIIFIFSDISAQSTLEQNIDQVTITSNRSKYKNDVSIVYTINSDEIENTANQTIGDILEFAINVDNRERGGQGIQSDISIRGGSFEQTLILINGIKLNDPQTGHHNLNLPISTELIERIEISTGGSTRIYGNYAYCGVINIITKTKVSNSVILSKGQNNFNHGELNFNISNSKVNQIFHLLNKNSDGYISGTDYKLKNFFYQAKSQINSINTTLNAGINKKDFGAYGFYSTKYPNQFEKTKTTFASLNLNKKGNLGFNNNIYWRLHEDEFILFRDNPSLYQNFHKTSVIGVDINVIKKTKSGTSLLGAELISNSIISNNLGKELDIPILINGDNYYTKSDSRIVTNFFIENNISINRLNISTGIMLNVKTNFENDIFPGIDLSYKLSDKIKFYLSSNKSMRTPNFTELYYSSPTNQGNINLEAEKSISKEFGIKINNDFHNSTITLFERNGENLIDWILLDGDSIWRTQNLNEIKSSGIELNSRINIRNILNSKINHFRISIASNKLDTISNGFRSAYVIDNLKTNFSFSVNHNFYKNIMIDWKVSYKERIGDYFDPEEQIIKNYEPYWLTSVRMTKKINSNFNLFLDVNNLFDINYSDFGTIVQPGRWARIGLKAKI
ncbi:MAG: TonB-dependent receptor [Bacteroidota bacterium]|nr:TonB-dependent receptor [Bacteroidota bacterium]